MSPKKWLPLRANSELPLYQQLYEILRDFILAEEYSPGEQLPSERDLRDIYGISRHTVRQAFAMLEEEGLARKHPGLGIFVAPLKFDHRLKLRGFSEEMERDGLVYVNRVLHVATVPVKEDLATQLNVDAGSRAHLLQRVRMIHRLPVGVETAYLPASYFPDLLTHDFSGASLYKVLEEVEGIRLTRAEQEISARCAAPEECTHLRLQDPAAVLSLERRTYDNRARIVEYVQGVYNPRRYTIVATIRR